MITLIVTANDVGITNQGLENFGACPQSMLAPKDEDIANWFNFLKINIFWIFHIFFIHQMQVLYLVDKMYLHNLR